MQKPFTIEPVMIVAKAVEPIFPGQINLCLPHFGQPQIVETKIGWQVWLVVASKERPRFHNVGPLSKPLAPPRIVFRDRVKLRQVKSNRPDSHPPPADSRLTNTAKNMLIKTECMSTAIL